MKINQKSHNFIYNLFNEKCPNCKDGHPFKKGLGLFTIPQMKERCENCNYKFEREPGFFIGAMYVSYGLAIAESVAVFVTVYVLFPNLQVEWLLLAITTTLILLAKKNYKWSRLLYLYIFPL